MPKFSKRGQVQTDTFLNTDEMYDLTGFKSPRKQCLSLRKMGIPFFVNGRGYPRIFRTAVLPNQPVNMKKEKEKWQPNINLYKI